MKAQRPFNFDEAVVSQMENIRRIGLRRLHNRSEIDDFVQETILRAYAKRDQLRDETKFDRWIAVIARNLALDWNSALCRRGREEPIDELPDIPDEKTPHDILERKEERRELHQAMGRLNEDDREMLRARYFEDASYEELQEKYGLSYSAVGFRLHRAKARLRKILTSTAAAFIAVFIGFRRAAWGGILLMTKTTKIIVAAAAAAAGILIGGYIWLNSADAERDSTDSPITLEEQSPRMTPLSAVRSTGGGSASDSAGNQPEAVQTGSEASAAGQTSNADAETTAAAPVETETEEEAEEADKQAAIAVFKAFENAMLTLDIEKALSMARGQAHAVLGSLALALAEKGDSNMTSRSPDQPLDYKYVYADGELRVTSNGDRGDAPLILRKTDGKWYVESVPAFVSASKTTRDEHGNVLEHIDTGDLPLTPENVELTEGILER